MKTRTHWILFIVLLIIMTASTNVYGKSREEAVEAHVLQGTLKGTMVLPESTDLCPVVLIIAGSGPTDRNGNNHYKLKANYLKMLADDLAQQGIASLRYDKRQIGESDDFKLKEKDLHFDDYVQDASAWVSQLRQDKRFSTVIVAGHSEGALIGILVAQQQPIDGLISLAGPGYPLQTTLLRQISEHQPQIYPACADIIAKLEKGIPVEVTDPVLKPLLRSSVQPFLISQFRYNPSSEISKVKVPILLIQGTRDLQLQVADAKSLQHANPNAKLVIIDGMNHMLKFVTSDIQFNINSYSDPIKPLAAPVIPAITDFIKQISIDENKQST
jgi:pimeloyl-ACP methyl ester carboxylesterase